MHYLVTGGAGFIGSHIADHLARAGEDVTVLDDLSTGRRENLAALPAGVRFVEGTITDAETCRRVVADADYVVHQAALPSVPRSIENPLATHAVAATGTLNLLDAARRTGRVQRFVYAASSSAYGDTDELHKREAEELLEDGG